MDKRNAEKGKKHEHLFANGLKKHPEVIARLKEYFRIQGDFVMAYPTGSFGGKADVILSFSDPLHLRANVKSFGKIGINQAARGNVQSFVDQCGLHEISEILHAAVIRKAKRGRFILEEEQEAVRKVFAAGTQKIVNYALARKEEPELLVLYDNVRGVMYLYDLAKLLKQISYDLTFSRPGNIMIGEHLLFHRKGGDGNNKKYDKYSPNHPGNNLAVKLLCKQVIRDFEPIVSYKS